MVFHKNISFGINRREVTMDPTQDKPILPGNFKGSVVRPVPTDLTNVNLTGFYDSVANATDDSAAASSASIKNTVDNKTNSRPKNDAGLDTVSMGGRFVKETGYDETKDSTYDIYSRDGKPGIIRVIDPIDQLNKQWMERISGFMPDSTYFNEIDAAYRSSGCGGFDNQIQTFCYGLDRFNKNTLPMNAEHSGLTFITRPRLNLTTPNLRQERMLLSLDTDHHDTIPFMIRCLLDTVLAGPYPDHTGTVTPELKARVLSSPLFNYYNPFMTPVCNALTSITGFPDPILETFSTEKGFHSEDQTFPIGYDYLNGTYELQLQFKDIQGGVVMALFYYWLYYMACVVKGSVLAHKEDIDKRRMNFTVSIYRFILDPSRRRIIRWAKATGCFPKSVPYGAVFNINEGEQWITAASKFAVPFVANKIEYNDYVNLYEFNRLARRYYPGIDRAPTVRAIAPLNYFGIPFIESTQNGNFLVFKEDPNVGETLPDGRVFAGNGNMDLASTMA